MSQHHWLAPPLVVAVAMGMAGIASAAGPISEDAYDRCRAISDDSARLHCFESLTSQQPRTAPSADQAVPFGFQSTPDVPQDWPFGSQAAKPSLPIAGKWRLVHTPNPREGRDVVSIMATAELSGSDVDFAGVNLRCADRDFEILVFLIGPLAPQTRPAVAMNGKTFQGSVVSPGTAILLPHAAATLAKEQWLKLPDLSVEVDDGKTKTHGLVSLKGFDTALQTLVNTCLTR